MQIEVTILIKSVEKPHEERNRMKKKALKSRSVCFFRYICLVRLFAFSLFKKVEKKNVKKESFGS